MKVLNWRALMKTTYKIMDEREVVLNNHIKHYQLDMDAYELYSILYNRNFDKLKGKID